MKDLITAMRVLAEEVEKQAIAMCINSYDPQLMALSYALCSASVRLEAELPKESEWIHWSGGDAPPSVSNRLVVVRFRGYPADHESSPAKAVSWDWRHRNLKSDIIAYRVIPQ